MVDRHMSLSAYSVVTSMGKTVSNSLALSVKNAGPFMPTAALLAVIAHPLFYVIWRYVFPQPYENLPLRLVGSLLAVPILFRDRWPEKLVKYLPVYFHVAVFYNLPFIFSFLLIKNDFSQVWVLSTVGAAFVLTFLLEWRAVAVLYIIGVLFGGIYGFATADNIADAASLKYVVILLFPLVFGAIFSYQLQRYRAIQSKLEKRIRKISEQNAKMIQEQNQLLSLFLSNTIVARLRQFQKRFGLDAAISMITRQEKRFCGIMQADIRNFTKIFGHESELVVAQLVRRCFTKITAVGQDLAVIKPVGDCLFIYSDDVSSKENAALNILSLAVFFVHSLAKVNQLLVTRGDEPLNFGIAVHVGEVIYGNLASDTLIDPTIIGVDVNKTARLEELTKAPEVQRLIGINAILISEEAARYGRNFLSSRLLTPINLYELRLTVRDFPDVKQVYALPSAMATLLYDHALEHIQVQRRRLPLAAGRVEAGSYHGIPYYYEMQGEGPSTSWTIMIDVSALPLRAVSDYAAKTFRELDHEIRQTDGHWLILSTGQSPGEYDESDVEARVFRIIQELEQVVRPVHI